MTRRRFLAASAATGASLLLPGFSGAQNKRLLKYIPQSDVAVLDPIFSSAYITRNHAFVIFDTLYGHDSHYRASPQMVEGHTVDNNGRLWKLRLREGLKWHDGEKVLARDCVASINRWGKKDPFGQALMAATDELSATDDRSIQFKLKRPFPLLPDALGKSTSHMPAMMPERLAQTDPNKQVTEMVGSGPFRYVAADRVAGQRTVYERFAAYVPRKDGTPEFTSGPKITHFDRMEWTVVPDASTAAAAKVNREHDWWVFGAPDLLPMLRKSGKLKLAPMDEAGSMGLMRMNQLQAPFNNPAIRRTLLGAINQADYMTAVATEDKSYWKTPVGFWTPGTPLASATSMGAIKAQPDFAQVKKDLVAAGYKGEKVMVLAPGDIQVLKAMADVGADMLTKCGMNVEFLTQDWGTVTQRLAKKDPVEQGGWSCFFNAPSGSDMVNPASHLALRSNGANAWLGWPDSPKIEDLRQQWLDAPNEAARKKVGEEIQRQAFIDVPYLPLGQFYLTTVYNAGLAGVLPANFPVFWNVRRG